jgi:hypothetical protein
MYYKHDQILILCSLDIFTNPNYINSLFRTFYKIENLKKVNLKMEEYVSEWSALQKSGIKRRGKIYYIVGFPWG